MNIFIDIVVFLIGFFLMELSFFLMLFGYMLMFEMPEHVWQKARKNIDALDPYIIDLVQPRHLKIQWVFIPAYSIICALKLTHTIMNL